MYNNNKFKLIPLYGIWVFIGIILGLVFTPLYKTWSTKHNSESRLYKAEQDRRILIEEETAKLEAAKIMAMAEVERAKGTFESNKILVESFGNIENYLRYLWINNLSKTQNKIIYVQAETGLPTFEAGKVDQ